MKTRCTILLLCWLSLSAGYSASGRPPATLDSKARTARATDCAAKTQAQPEDSGPSADQLQETYFTAAARHSGQKEAAETGEKILKKLADDPQALNEFAWTVLTDETLRHRDYPLALRAARQAFEKSRGHEYPIVDTLARALLMTGQTNDAITMQKKAVGLCDNPKVKLELRETLAGYEQPAVDPGADDEARLDRFIEASQVLVGRRKTASMRKLLGHTALTPCKVPLAKPSEEPLSSERLYETARESVLLLGTFTRNRDADDWSVALASGFLLSEDGVFVTNFHVLDPPEAQGMTAMTSDGKIFSVKSVLAVSPFADVAICQLEGVSGLKPLPLVPNAKPGAHVRVLSHPNNALYSLTEGILSRYFVFRADGKATTMLTTTAEFAVGSSGGPLLDDRGNVIGMVAATDSIYSGPDEEAVEAEPKDAPEATVNNGDLQMVLKMCVPSSEILRLIVSP